MPAATRPAEATATFSAREKLSETRAASGLPGGVTGVRRGRLEVPRARPQTEIVVLHSSIALRLRNL